MSQKKFRNISNAQWKLIKSLMNWNPPLERGIKRTSFRKIWNSIFYILIHGCRWIDLPKQSFYAKRSTAHRWLKRWENDGVFDRVLKGLTRIGIENKKVDLSTILVDGSFSPCARRGRKD
jgi:transposase